MIVEVNNITKSFKIKERKNGFIKNIFSNDYREITAVKNLSLNISKGDILGYIGVNGAGKSTTIKMLIGILLADSGNIKIFGKDPYMNRIEISKKIGVVFGQRSQLIWDLPPIDTFKLLSKIYEIPNKVFLERISNISSYLNLNNFINTPVRKLSLGQRMCCEITASLLHNPEILFIDEPTIGLDVNKKEKIRKFILEINNEYQTSIFLTSHDMIDVEKLANKIIAIDNGSKIFDGTINELRDKYGIMKTIKIEFDQIIDNKIILQKLNELDLFFENNILKINYNNNLHNSANILRQILDLNYDIKNIDISEPEIDEIIKLLYSSKISGGCSK